jgi:hypothetical protein
MIDLATHLREFRVSAFRLETRDRYAVPQEAEWFAEWRRSGKLPELTPDTDSWLMLVSEASRSGKQMRRVHLVTPPLSEYLRFEFATQIHSVECGEDCRIAETTGNPRLTQIARESCDFWLFDSSTVAVLDYDDHGRFLAVREVTNPRHYLEQRDLVLAHSVSLKEYLAKL